MSPWTALLESLHSALIDEVTERQVEPKPELGLPQRQARFALPSPDIEKLLIVEVSLGGGSGIALLAAPQASKLWDAMVKRAGPEFTRRQIQPKFSAPQEVHASDTFPASTVKCSRVIWFPITLSSGQWFFGVGV